MPTYQITYIDTQKTLIDSEAIFMKSLATAKRSAEHHAPSNTEQIIIQDLIDRELSRHTVNEGWTDALSY
ncbi:hypothetical protein P3656_11525 [Vibrio parahaemolyticus]|uniref:hypothetical protein n=1 Tax=Vibrio parahaemolyticus TaxID=670 RepID=UPI00146C5BAE|nr:hypothetical protein [Vibrio parahaemolyticus]MDF5022315.1 hypothetical protein [Vibrio parahaemolyticus]MDF5041609.1 hypothetical protein [Vibrio parahaemolyticus]MDF5157767.1 hypothetical protein [Vibrio parahaemolyticus]MDF5161845.1 hypothetical protein [Vibrio parahaemolyticus]MDF5171402.1 hypothetical protein [Vibrio parahaemolyticus]